VHVRSFVWPLVVVPACLAMVTSVGASPTGIEFFQTPSRNIHCAWSSSPSSLRCDIDSGLLPKPQRPASCDLDFGDSLSLGRTGRARLVCHGDTTKNPKASVLAYGKTWARGGIRCKSRRDGLRCTNASAHGFFLSKQRWHRF
jgi:hypothetical protein